MGFLFGRTIVEVSPDLGTVVVSVSSSGPQLATPGNPNEVLFFVPGGLCVRGSQGRGASLRVES